MHYRIIERQDFKIIFQYHPVVPPGKDKSPYRMLSQDFVRIETFWLHEFIRVDSWDVGGRYPHAILISVE